MRLTLNASVAYRALIWGMSVFMTVGATAAWAKETVLSSFMGGKDGSYPVGPLIKGPKGELYGTTTAGGAGNGTVFELDPPAPGKTAWTEKVLYKFQGARDGSIPLGGLIRDKTGALYGTTSEGGPYACSTYKSYHYFTDHSGNLLSRTYWRPNKTIGCGTVFRLTPPARQGGVWTETVLHQFGKAQGRRPAGSLLMDKTGALYGTTSEGGGSAQCNQLVSTARSSLHSMPPRQSSGVAYAYGCGAIFKLTPPAGGKGAWKETTLYVFAGNGDGSSPQALRPTTNTGITASTSFFVLASGAGASGAQENGTLVLLTPKSGGAMSSKVLHTFTGSDGALPSGPLLADTNGNLYVSTESGGGSGYGAISQFSPAAGGTWTGRTIYSFGPNLTQGFFPIGLTNTAGFDGVNVTGSLYGVATQGGNLANCQKKGCGVLFALKPSSPGSADWSYSVKYIFGSGADGKTPKARPTIDGSGTIYGTTEGGGKLSRGTVYEITP